MAVLLKLATGQSLGGSWNFPSARNCVNTIPMANQTVLTRKRGPKPTGKGTLVGTRFQPPQLAAIDAWREKEDDTPSRPEAVRRLVEKALSDS